MGNSYSFGNVDYDFVDISKELVSRMEYWCGWRRSSGTHSQGPDFDKADWEAYGQALAIDLKRELGDNYRVSYEGKEIGLMKQSA